VANQCTIDYGVWTSPGFGCVSSNCTAEGGVKVLPAVASFTAQHPTETFVGVTTDSVVCQRYELATGRTAACNVEFYQALVHVTSNTQFVINALAIENDSTATASAAGISWKAGPFSTCIGCTGVTLAAPVGMGFGLSCVETTSVSFQTP